MLLQGTFLSGLAARITKVPETVLAALLVVICAAGAYSVNGSALDVKVFVLFGGVAYVLGLMKIPAVPVVLGFVLGDMVDYNLRRGLTMCGGNLWVFITRPITLAILVLMILFLAYNGIQNARGSRQIRESGDKA